MRRPSSLETRFRRVIGDICGAGLGRTVLLHGPWLASLCRRRRPRVKTAAKARAQPRPTWPPRCTRSSARSRPDDDRGGSSSPALRRGIGSEDALSSEDLKVELLLEDAADNPPEPFDVARCLASAATLRSVPDAQVSDWLAEFAALSADIPDRDYIEQQADFEAPRLEKARPAFQRPPQAGTPPPAACSRSPVSGGRLAARTLSSRSPGSR